MRNPCVAHRGWSGAAPENTLAAVRLAADADDVEWAEIDVQLSSDGIPVLMHDKRLNRTTNGGRTEAARVAAAKLRSLDAGSWFSPAFKQEGVPLLEEVLRETGDRLKFNIELKRHDRGDGLLEERVAEAVERSGMRERSVLTSFSRESLRHLRSLDTGIKTGLISDSWSASLPAELSALGCSLLSADHSAMNRERIRLLKAAGIRTMVWTLNDFRLIRRYALMDPSVLICTNYPDRWREALRSLPQPLELPGREAWPG
ncbi:MULTISPECIES: glycerophosphodiester phosphodiesterase family protein [unclassified Paenibacillus]|uniref:glycerophosphodiester phosphodiesterase n=1 Tax=unclassified Paenibacillus TaxID=185978 RepID=UPI000954D397|nr:MULTISPECIES: glycerophosphodiester phosphodiesterase family protein [unclassified Paenibacillus]ASS64855.1 glycerophosphodiester phosphodiesterase [Paenibacillus sp. RUD330]SIR03675.1 glycerophosphoryl diester phosphodiesterase [Paenibacillus sp. RU4X]SIR31638.1 glycerophosphoryl diester phosphodiesterase [Paenibacillus sp. RU4T]